MTESPHSLSVIVPAYNEEANLPVCLAALHATLALFPNPYAIIIVDDGSLDRTLELARRLAAERPDRVSVLAHARNLGFGAALRTGFAAARADYVTCCPADFPVTPDDWRPFTAALGTADVIVGCRRRREGYNPLMRFNAWLYPKLISALFGLRLRDVNWICIYRRKLLERLTITQNGIPMLVEILVKLRDQGATFREVDCRMLVRTSGTPSAAKVKHMWRTLIGLLHLWATYERPPDRAISVRVSAQP
jgi:glycosyltransferase involved in cell wall biosynthesis